MAMTKEQRAEMQRECVKRWKNKNPEKVKAQKRRYYLKHRDDLKLKMKARYQTYRAKAQAYDELMKGGAENG